MVIVTAKVMDVTEVLRLFEEGESADPLRSTSAASVVTGDTRMKIASVAFEVHVVLPVT
jgi:hypothetical protein